MSRSAAVVRLAVWSVFLVLVLRLLHGSTLGTLSVPLGSLDELSVWAETTSPTVMAMSLVRLAALVGAWYLVAATVLLVVADVTGWRALARAVAAVSPAVVRRLATRGASAGLAAGALLGGAPLPAPVDAHPGVLPPSGLATPLAPVLALRAAPAGAAAVTPPGPLAVPERAPDTATMTRLPGAPDGRDPSAAAATATMDRLPDGGSGPPSTAPAGTTAPPASPDEAPSDPADEAATTGVPTIAATTAPPAAAVTTPPSGAPAGPTPRSPAGTAAAPTQAVPSSTTRPAGLVLPADTSRSTSEPDDDWVVEFGDSFWSIAEEAVAERTTRRRPTEAEVAAYWRRLVDANRDRLVDARNPDLLLPGQRLVVPPPG
jgi:hypothetical protein